ncbi:MAG: hypothetical protein LBH11_07010 [Propionibacteriaceae bacterium]|jgi:alpha-L-fucosidase|nr:hypothetical protein [Propionibacteriaceae bacterium]
MTTRRDILKRIEKAAKKAGVTFGFVREGGDHTIYTVGGKEFPIVRKAGEVGDRYAEMLYREAEEVLGKGWWRK